MKKGKIIGLLLLMAFIFTMGFNELAFAAGFVPPAWSQKLPAKQRFQLVLDNQAVLDKETGLVWERSPSTTKMDWYSAIYYCYDFYMGGRVGGGGRGGWRLPRVEELMSLVDRSQGPITLPAGHPFLNVQLSGYWSASSVTSTYARVVIFLFGSVGSAEKYDSDGGFVWCVRGGHGYDAY